ncbi:MAG: NYN domain-containing protein [Ramlibacter sp.]|nr:NYN domain-containing protein [Ramlibacter sp.]
MNNSGRVMLLIDADNVSADVIEQAVQRTMAGHGAIHVRRAYCNAEAAVKHQALFKRLSVRPMVNLSAGKNSTDIALAVDAIDLVIAERPDLVVLVSSDSDFAPLVIRLREKGCRVCGIGQQGKTGEETTAVYDEFIDLRHQPARAAARPTPAPAVKRPARAPARAKAAVAAPVAPAPPDDVVRILQALPEMRAGERMELNQAAEALRAAKLLGRGGSSLKLFKKHPEFFALTPETRPSKVQYLRAQAR